MTTMNVYLRGLERALVSGSMMTAIAMHDELLAQLRNPHTPAPDWERYPVGRNFFLQYEQHRGPR